MPAVADSGVAVELVEVEHRVYCNEPNLVAIAADRTCINGVVVFASIALVALEKKVDTLVAR